MICGTRGDPDTVAPFRAWRGSRDLVAQSPKFHAPAAAQLRADAEKSLAQRFRVAPERAANLQSAAYSNVFEWRNFRRALPRATFRILVSRLRRSIRRLHFGRIHPVHFERANAMNLHDRFAFAHREMPHFLRHRNEVPDIHCLQFAFVIRISRCRQEKFPSAQSGIRPWDANAPEPWLRRRIESKNKRCILRIRITGHRRDFAPFHDGVHFKSPKCTILCASRARLFLLAVNHRRA